YALEKANLGFKLYADGPSAMRLNARLTQGRGPVPDGPGLTDAILSLSQMKSGSPPCRTAVIPIAKRLFSARSRFIAVISCAANTTNFSARNPGLAPSV